MKPAPFDYYAPDTLEEAVSLLEKFEEEEVEAKIIAGGQSFVPLLAIRMARPEALVDLRKLSTLNFIREENDAIVIGAMTSKSAVEDSPLVQEKHPLLEKATLMVGHRAIRNRGTFGGSFTQADPASEYPGLAVALNMEMKAVGPDGERIIPADEFFVTFLTTDLESTEILTEIKVPKLAAGTGWAIQEQARRVGDFAIAGVIATLRLSGGKCTNTTIVAYGVNGTPVRLENAQQLVEGQAPSEALFVQAGEAGAAEIDEPISCMHASAEQRRGLIKVFVARVLAEAITRAA